MEMTPSIKNSLFTAIVVGTSTTAAYASAELSEANVVQADVSGFEATVTLKNQPVEEIESIDLTRNAAASQANTEASRKLNVSLEQGVDGSNINHLIRVKGPGSVSAENLAFNVQVSKLDGSKLVKGYDIKPEVVRAPDRLSAPSMLDITQGTVQTQPLSESTMPTPSAEALMAMAEFEEVPGINISAQQVDPSIIAAMPGEEANTVATNSTRQTTAQKANLELSDIKAKSTMGEILSLEFEISGKNIRNANDLVIQISPDSSLGALSTEAAVTLATLDQKVVKKAGNRYLIQLSSLQPVNEPLVPLLINVQAGDDTQTRQYSVLLDPPKNLDPVNSTDMPYLANNGDFIMVDKPAYTAKTKKAAATVVASSKKQSGGGTSHYVVSEGETLAGIAANLKGRAPLSEKMRILRDSNPQAFINGDVNQIVAGTTLKIPASWKTLAKAPVKTGSVVETAPSRVEQEAQAQVAQTPPEDVSPMENVAAIQEEENPNNLDQLIGDETVVAEILPPATQPATPVATTTEQTTVTPVVETVAEEGLLSTDNLAIAGGVAAAALAAGGLVMMRRRRNATTQEEFSLDGEITLAEQEEALPTLLNTEEAISLDGVDYLAEAEALLARGQIDQADLLLQTGVTEQPSNSGLIQRMFEVIALKRDSALFNSKAIALATHLRQDKALLGRVNQLAQKMTPVPEVFRNMTKQSAGNTQDMLGQTAG